MNMPKHPAIRLLLLCCAALAVSTGCEREMAAGEDFAITSLDMSPEATLAIEHDVTVELPDDDIGKAHQAVLDACKGNTGIPCTVLESTVGHGDIASSGSLRLRVGPKAVEPLVALAGTFGEVTRRTTRAEDLAKPILDTNKRLAMLEAYLEDLTRLRQQSRQEVDALIRVAAEIAKTQSELDAAKADQAQLRQRVDLQILSIGFYSEQVGSFGATIGEALKDFGENLGSGIAQAIIGIAFLLPWLVILIPLLFLLRRLWRKYR